MHELYELKEMLCKELEEIGGKGELTAGSLETVDTLAHALKNIDKIIENKENDGYSSRYYDGGVSYARGRGSNARRDSMGRYSSRYDGYSRNRDGYSRNDGGYSMDGGEMAQKLRTMAEEVEKM